MSIEIKLTQGYMAIIDEIDGDLATLKWHASVTRRKFQTFARACRSPRIRGKQTSQTLSRVIGERMVGRQLDRREIVDHISGDPLDNRRANLRICTQQQNSWNRAAHKNNKTGYRGVCLVRETYKSQIHVSGKQISIGYYKTPEAAAIAYNTVAKKLFGEFARLNKVPNPEKYTVFIRESVLNAA